MFEYSNYTSSITTYSTACEMNRLRKPLWTPLCRKNLTISRLEETFSPDFEKKRKETIYGRPVKKTATVLVDPARKESVPKHF